MHTPVLFVHVQGIHRCYACVARHCLIAMIDASNDLPSPVLAVALELDRHVQQALHLGSRQRQQTTLLKVGLTGCQGLADLLKLGQARRLLRAFALDALECCFDHVILELR